jgi:hypothetical protein
MDARHARTLGIAVVGIALGAVREFMAVNLNYQIDAVRYQRVVSYAHSLFQAGVEGWSLAALVRLKWGLALFFSALMCLLCVALARVLNGDHRHRRAIVTAFLITGALALVLHLASIRVPQFAPASIKLLHLMQYPVVLFFVWAASWLEKRA